MAWTTPGTATAGSVLTASFWNTQVRDNFVEQFPVNATVQDWVPVMSGGWLMGNATYTAKYWRVGKIVSFYANIVIGSTTTKGTQLIITVPVNAATFHGLMACNAYFEDVGSANVGAMVIINDVNKVELLAVNSSTTYTQGSLITSTVPFTWATNDVIRFSGSYVAA